MNGFEVISINLIIITVLSIQLCYFSYVLTRIDRLRYAMALYLFP